MRTIEDYLMKKRIEIIIILISLVLLSLGIIFINNTSFDKLPSTKAIAQKNISTPTLFVHGWKAGLHSELPLANLAVKTGVAQRGLIIKVSTSGRIYCHGSLTGKSAPEILVKFCNYNAGEFKYARWLHQVMMILKTKYGVTHYNAIGHSMGAYALVAYNEMYGNQANLPILNKLVLIAGPFDGILNRHRWNQPITGKVAKLWDDSINQNRLLPNGRPQIIHAEYRYLLKRVTNFPNQARVLNIYGNLDNGSNSDGTVSVTSALSLGYLLKNHVKGYQVMGNYGYTAEHTLLNEINNNVKQRILKFIWCS